MTAHVQANGGRPHQAGLPGGRRTLWLILLGAAAVFLIVLLGVRFTFLGNGAPDTPTGLSVSGDSSTVRAAWTGVSGADEYVLTRDDGVVVYQGSGTSVVDDRVGAGEHTYHVQSMSGGVLSAPSSESKATTDGGWGSFLPFVKEFPKLLPQTPDSAGWESLQCRKLYSGFNAEVGTEAAGSGELLGKTRMSCSASKGILMSIASLQSKEATDAVFATASKKPGAQAVRWRYGTGYVVEAAHTAYLRPDTHENVYIAIGVDDADKQKLLDTANSMPLE